MKIEKGINEPKLKQAAALLLEAGYSNIVVYATRVKKTGTTLYWQHISAGGADETAAAGLIAASSRIAIDVEDGDEDGPEISFGH